MKTLFPPLDMHAHIDASISTVDLHALRAVIFAATRSLAEAATAVRRNDETVIWGVGSHPCLASSHGEFDEAMFSDLIAKTALVSEFGLDGKSRVSLQQQRDTLRRALGVLAEQPRLISLHSYAATGALIDELERHPVKGTILHWWLGDEHETLRALELGCYFSVNASSVRRGSLSTSLPLDRVLPETDHPYGDKSSERPRQPGAVGYVESALASHFGVDATTIRRQTWMNLARLVKQTGCGMLLPRRVRALLVSVPSSDVGY